jgi:XTP/dITP diphosphohydrolase
MLQVPPLILGSRNRKKSREVTEILAPCGITVQSIAEFPEVGEVIEDGATFADNAAKKAAEPALRLGRWVIGEDSGLAVDALAGAPGVFSARYSGPGATDESNNRKLLAELSRVPPEKRTAAYICTIALSDPNGTIRVTAKGFCRGLIIDEARGENGFGYDPYFLIREYHRTFGELSSRVKHQISHRARAFALFVPRLLQLFDREPA